MIGGCSTLPEHRPQAHQAFAQGRPAALLAWAQTQGGALHQFIQQHIEENRRPTLSAQACRGLQRLVRDFDSDRVQAACARAVELRATRVPSLESMLHRGLETAPLPCPPAANDDPLPPHDNVRGAEYFH